MKEKLLLFLHSLTPYDYIFFAAVFIFFLLLIVLVLLLRKKVTLALTLLLIAILEITLGSTLGFHYFHNMLYKNTVTVTKAKRLTFLPAVVIEGRLKNESKFDFSSCRLKAKIFKQTDNTLKNIVLRLKPIKTKTIELKQIPKNTDIGFKFLIEPFTYKKDINISVSGICK